jgi:hypothetical protein
MQKITAYFVSAGKAAISTFTFDNFMAQNIVHSIMNVRSGNFRF